MIFVSVGSQLPFPRLVEVVNRWTAIEPDVNVIAQVGLDDRDYEHCDVRREVSPSEYASLMQGAELAVSHAGMGTVLSALRAGTPLVVMPRLAAYRETRSDHQVETARWLEEDGRVFVARDEEALLKLLGRRADLAASSRIPPFASAELLAAIREFIHVN